MAVAKASYRPGAAATETIAAACIKDSPAASRTA
ncbi:hypothetical protein AHiyo6_16750, partial [Arthrobacter sp. Hiyo6]